MFVFKWVRRGWLNLICICVWIKKIKITRMKKMNEKNREDMVGVLVIRVVILCSHPIDILGAWCFLEKTIRREFQFLTF